MWDYTEKTKELFRHPKNSGEMKAPDAVGEVGSLICGDALKLFLEIDRESGIIRDASFLTFGCASAIASSSALTEMVKGRTLDEAMAITNRDIAEYLGGLPGEKMHCSVMGMEALQAAINNYRGVAGEGAKEHEPVCKCFDVTEETIRQVAGENRLHTVEEVTNFTKAGGGCGSCVDDIARILRDLWHEAVPPPAPRPKAMTNLRRIALIQETLEREVRPRLQADGGDVELMDIDGADVTVALRAMCTGCQMADVTVKSIEDRLRELVDDNIRVHQER